MTKQLLVTVRLHGRDLRTYALRDEEIKIGRDSRAHITLPRRDVSRLHCSVRRTGDVYELDDTDSANGTVINGVKHAKGVISLNEGDVIEIGAFTLLVRFASTEEDKLSYSADSLGVPTLRASPDRGDAAD